MTIIFSERYLDHIQTPDHPESPNRLRAIREVLMAVDFWNDIHPPRDASDEEILRVHTPEYLEFISTAGETMVTMDTVMHEETHEIARLAAGGGIVAAESAWNDCRPAIALLRPPGHHAGPGYSMGFCYLNNIAIAARHILNKCRKIAIVDIDVHHGNGTQDAFYEQPEVLYISSHQKNIFPGTGRINEFGKGDGEGFTVNIPLKDGAGDASFELAYDEIILPVLGEFAPEMLMVSLGTDSHYRDPLASLTLSSSGYAREIKQILDFGRSHCSNRIAFFLEGGYDLESLSEVVAHTVGLFNGGELSLDYRDVLDRECLERKSLENILELQRDYWNLH